MLLITACLSQSPPVKMYLTSFYGFVTLMVDEQLLPLDFACFKGSNVIGLQSLLKSVQKSQNIMQPLRKIKEQSSNRIPCGVY